MNEWLEILADYGLFHGVVRASLQMTVLIGLLWILRRVLGDRLPARFFVGMGVITMIGLLVPFRISSPVSVHNTWAAIAEMSSRPAVEVFPPPISGTRDVLEGGIPDAAPRRGSPQNSGLTWKRQVISALFWIWLSGVAYLCFLRSRQYRETYRAIAQGAEGSKAIERLLTSCREELNICRSVSLVTSSTVKAPAVFGCWSPVIIVPKESVHSLSESSMRMVFLHELAHVKRQDPWLNWIMVFTTVVHWFNPAVWWAMRRLGEDRELVCDEFVLSRLKESQRREYGHALIRFSEAISGIKVGNVGIVSMVHDEKLIKRRVIMIKKFKPVTVGVSLLGLVLMAVLSLATLTTATEGKDAGADGGVSEMEEVAINAESSGLNASEREAQVDQEEAKTIVAKTQGNDPRLEGVRQLEKAVIQASYEIKKLERELASLEQELGVPGDIRRGDSVRSLNPERSRSYQAKLVELELERSQLHSLFKELERIPEERLRHVLPTAVPDEAMTSLLKDLSKAEQSYRTLLSDFGTAHPEAKKARDLMDEINRQISDRSDGILTGLQTRISATDREVEFLEGELERNRAREIEFGSRLAPYFEAKRKLESRRRIRDAFEVRLAQEKIDSLLPPNR